MEPCGLCRRSIHIRGHRLLESSKQNYYIISLRAIIKAIFIHIGTVRDGNKLLDVIHEFEFWSGLRISIPKSVATGAMYGTGMTRRQEGAKVDVAKRKRDAGPDILEPQIRALKAMDEALNTDNNTSHNLKGQEAWRMNLAMMHRQCPICNKKKGNCHFPTQLHLNPPFLECRHAWKPAGIKYNGTALKVTDGKTPIRLLGIQYNIDIIPVCYTGHPASHPDAMFTSRWVYYRKHCSL